MDKRKKPFSAVITLCALVVFDVVVLLIGYKIDSFHVLKNVLNADGVIQSYEIDNSNLVIIFAISMINILAIYHIVANITFKKQLTNIDETGHISQGLKKIEVHLIDYNEDTVAFAHLSAIELEVGLPQQYVHNEIWILTNNFEEKKDSAEGKELRRAIISNLRTNVDYYYIVPPSHVDDILQLQAKLKIELGTKTTSGKLRYIIEEVLDFIPTPYFDIIMYVKFDSHMEFIESSSQIYYCFSRCKYSEDCFYQKVSSEAIWDKMFQLTKKYKTQKIPDSQSLL